ncbi:glycoside hydrolase family 3 C-terminal domain-containing protein [Actinoplanes sp. KI2]|uniref:beta-glucosidase family protein n=1 Tax=Actinoplanes sp. KI2 TaxID=2983315 RepID=UPI0021D5825D|nr:glycoside hydrolase family 3 C-terminal domain-containing protein [Actinoplanes sp. KI2]MCU7724976.1 glycoside hydrolase family 3 C-terminal domain-containing protein [Actinoplanes sp. KI2]
MNETDLLTGAGFWTTRADPALGLRSLVLSDGPVGVRGERWEERGSAVLPSPTAWAASWDEALATALGGLLAAEARRKGVDVLLGPTVNLHRSPAAGRHFECLSEDPLLTGRIGAALVRGVQAGGVAATAKHYVANDSETNRFTVDVRVGERALREVYLAPFEALVVDGGVWLVMAAYNRVNGVTMTESPLLATPLVTEWGFDGVVVSDWFATRSVVDSALAGLTLVMPGPGGPWSAGLAAAVSAGAVPRPVVSDKIDRLRRLASRVSGKSRLPGRGGSLLRRAAADGMVLVRNTAGALPLRGVRRVALLGPNAADPAIQGGGSAGLTPSYTVTPLDALASVVDVVHTAGAYRGPGLTPMAADLHVRYLDPAGAELRAEHRTTGRLVWSGDDIVPGTTVEVSGTFRAPAAGDWRIGFAGVGEFTLTLDGSPVLTETVGPDDDSFAAGLLDPPQRWVTRRLGAGDLLKVQVKHLPAYELGAAKLVVGVQPPRRSDEAELAAAVEAARGADAAVVVVGTDDRVESEGRDRAGLGLPGRQDDLVRAVAGVNPRTVVVVNSGSPVLLPWREQVAAVLLTWFPGQEFGNALADVLLGEREPGGRLPTTWPASERDVPVLSTRPDGDTLHYAEGLHIGYRAWLRSGATPAYPFGHGLGYTTWEYLGLTAEGPAISVRLRNAGDRSGKEVVQAYLSKPESSIDRPAVWLAGFAVVRARPGETVTATIALPERAFQHWDGGWRTEEGDYLLTVGRSVADRPLAAVISGRSLGVRPR